MINLKITGGAGAVVLERVYECFSWDDVDRARSLIPNHLLVSDSLMLQFGMEEVRYAKFRKQNKVSLGLALACAGAVLAGGPAGYVLMTALGGANYGVKRIETSAYKEALEGRCIVYVLDNFSHRTRLSDGRVVFSSTEFHL